MKSQPVRYDWFLRSRGNLYTGLLLIGLSCLWGCRRHGRPLPPTYPVHGKVMYQDGSLVSGGVVEFQPEADQYVTTASPIREDGTYSLKSIGEDSQAPGAVAGLNRVTVTPRGPAAAPPGGSGTHGPQDLPPVSISKPCQVEPHDNQIDLILDRLPPQR